MPGPRSILEETVATGDAVGAVGVAVDDDGTRFLGRAGWRDREARQEMASDTLFYIASMTKAVTSVAAMQCVERGELTLDGPIAEVLPMLADAPVLEGYDAQGRAKLRPARQPITLRHLLTHTSGLGYTTWNAALYEYRKRFPDAAPIPGPDIRRSAPLVREPGASWEYGTSTDFVGLAVEAVCGHRLGTYFEKNIFSPLGMCDTAFEVPSAKQARIAARYLRQADGTLARERPSREPAPVFQSGGGGLYSTAPDYARFMAALLGLKKPMEGLPELLSPETTKRMAENRIGTSIAGRMPSSEPHRSYDVEFFAGSNPGWGLGFLINPEPVAGGRSGGSLSWGGLYNSYFWLDPSSRVAGALFTQVLPFADPRVLRRLEDFERSVYSSRDGGKAIARGNG